MKYFPNHAAHSLPLCPLRLCGEIKALVRLAPMPAFWGCEGSGAACKPCPGSGGVPQCDPDPTPLSPRHPSLGSSQGKAREQPPSCRARGQTGAVVTEQRCRELPRHSAPTGGTPGAPSAVPSSCAASVRAVGLSPPTQSCAGDLCPFCGRRAGQNKYLRSCAVLR